VPTMDRLLRDIEDIREEMPDATLVVALLVLALQGQRAEDRAIAIEDRLIKRDRRLEAEQKRVNAHVVARDTLYASRQTETEGEAQTLEAVAQTLAQAAVKAYREVKRANDG